MADGPKAVTKGQLFWNAYGNIQAEVGPAGGYDFNRELLTYIQADDRYVSYVDEFLANATDLTEPKEAIRARAVAAHTESSHTLDTSPGYSTDMQGLANDFYFVIEQNYDNAPVNETAPVVETQAETATTVVAENVVEPVTAKPFDQEFATTQLGALAETPETKLVEPVTAPIAAADMPVPIVEEIKPVEPEKVVETAPVPAIEEIKPVEPEKLAEMAPVTVAETPSKETTYGIAPPEDTRTTADYTVARGDSLWKIAKDYYGLTNNREIQRAVDYIAETNNMTAGTAANHIRPGQVIQLPNTPVAPEGTKSLDWAALDAETKQNLRGTFRSATVDEKPQTDTTPKVSTETRVGLNNQGLTSTFG